MVATKRSRTATNEYTSVPMDANRTPKKDPRSPTRERYSRIERLRERTAVYRKETQKAGHLFYTRTKHLLPILVLLLYWAAGGLLFFLIEGNQLEGQQRLQKKLNEQKQKRAREIYGVAQIGNFTADDLMPTLGDLLIDVGLDKHDDYKNWTIWGSLFYAGTIFTTIGYGDTPPKTWEGKMCTVLYAIIGIPLVLLVLADVGQLFCVWIWKAYNLVVTTFIRIGGRCCPASAINEIGEFPVSIAIGLTIAWILFCSWVFTLFEESMPFVKSIYYFMITFTTIGLGDVVPSQPKTMVFLFALVIIGMAMVSMVWNLMQIKMDALVHRIAKGINQRSPDDQEVADDTDRPGRTSAEEDIGKLAGDNQWLVALMRQSHKKDLVNAWKKRARLVNKGVQCKVETSHVHTVTSLDAKSKGTQINLDCVSSRGTWIRLDPQMAGQYLDSLSAASGTPPYKETARTATGVETTDEFKQKLKELGYLLNDCRQLVRSESSATCRSSNTSVSEREPQSLPATLERQLKDESEDDVQRLLTHHL